MKGQGWGFGATTVQGGSGEEARVGTFCGCGLRAEEQTFTSGAAGRNEAEGKVPAENRKTGHRGAGGWRVIHGTLKSPEVTWTWRETTAGGRALITAEKVSCRTLGGQGRVWAEGHRGVRWPKPSGKRVSVIESWGSRQGSPGDLFSGRSTPRS